MFLEKFNSKEVDIWFTSDIHGFHKNITRGTSQWDGSRGLRDFETPKEMTQAMVDGINKYVKPNDILFHLGDWTFDGIERIWELRKMINCKNIYNICGNHDLKIIKNQVLPNCQQDPSGEGGIVDGSNPNRYSDDYRNSLFDVHAQELFVDVSMAKLIQIDKCLVYLSHFPTQEVRFDQRSIHLHGHVHGKMVHDEIKLDVGIDNAYKLFGEYRPFHWMMFKNILR